MAEFDTFDAFLIWFEKQKPEWQPVLAARIALRALPVAFADRSEENPLSSKDERVLLQLYRGVLALDNVARSEFGGNSQLFSDALDYFDEKDNDRVPHKTSDLVTLLVSYLKFVQLIYDHIEREQDTYEKAVKRVRDGRVSNMQLDFLDRAALLADLHKLDTISPAVLDTMPLFSDNGEGSIW